MENNHLELRKRVTNFLKYQGVSAKEMKKRTMSGEWMTDREISGFAQLLGVNIFSCMETMPGKWSYQQFPHPNEIHVPTSGAIYIANIPRNLHFQVVLLPWNNKNCVKHLNSFTTSKRAREQESERARERESKRARVYCNKFRKGTTMRPDWLIDWLIEEIEWLIDWYADFFLLLIQF